jgi:hypothetical protein
MKSKRHILAVSLATALGAAQAQEPPSADARNIERIDGRFSTFAGSSENLQSLTTGLRRGEPVKLTGSGESTVVVPPTKPMGQGNVTRSLDLASRQLAALGITEPTPLEIRAALNGGTVSTPDGRVTLQGVLQLRSEGMGWGKIAHTIGVHPGMGSSKPATPAAAPLPAPTPTSTPSPTATSSPATSGITTAAGTSVAATGGGRLAHKPAHASQSGAGVTTAAGGAAQSAVGVQTPKGQGNANGAGKGGGRS